MTVPTVRTVPARPLPPLCLAYLLALGGFFLCGAHRALSLGLLLVTVAVLFLLCVLRRVPFRRGVLIGMAVAVTAAFGMTQWTLSDMRAFAVPENETRTVTLTGTVKTLSYATDRGAAFVLGVDTLDGKRVSGAVRIEAEGTSYYAEPGASVTVRAVLGEADLRKDYETYRIYDFPDRIYAYARIAEGDGVFSVTEEAHGFSAFCQRAVSFCSRRLYRFLDSDSAALVSGILFGDTDELSPVTRRDFRRVGLSHILAVSGIHISILLGGAQRLLGRLDKRVCLLLVAAFLVLFMGMTGFSPSVLRAGIMWLLTAAAFYTKSTGDGISALFGAAFFICIFRPTAVCDIGFLLSSTATLGILLLSQPTADFLARIPQSRLPGRIAHAVLSHCALTLTATVFTLPVMLFAFGELSLIAPLANLLLHPFVSLILYLTPVLLLCALLPFSFPAVVLGGCISGVTSVLTGVCAWLSAIPYAVVGVRYPFLLPLFVLFCVTVCAVLVCLRHRKHCLLAIFPLYAAFFVLFGVLGVGYGHLTRDRVTLDTSVYKQNDIVTLVSDGKGLLIDASDGALTSARYGWEQLSERNVTQVDALLYTHLHERHVATLAKFARETVLRTVFLPHPETEGEREIVTRLTEIAAGVTPPVTVLTYRRGVDSIMFGTAEIRTLPCAYLDRSVQPLYGYCITDTTAEDAQTVAVLSSAAYDPAVPAAFSAYRDAMTAQAQVLYLGTHGPHLKSVFGAGLDIAPAYLLCADAEVYTYCHDDLRSRAETVFVLSMTDSISVLLD